MVKEIEISVEAYNLLEKARLFGEDLNDTILRLIERTTFFERQKQIAQDDEFLSLEQSGE